MQAIGVAPPPNAARRRRSGAQDPSAPTEPTPVPESMLLLLSERPSDTPPRAPGNPASSRTTNMLLMSPTQQAAETLGAAEVGAATAAAYQHFRGRDGARGDDARAQGGPASLVRTSALTHSILTEAISNARGAVGAHDTLQGALGQRQIAGGLGGGRNAEHPLVTRQVHSRSIWNVLK